MIESKKLKASILYSWANRTSTCLLPNHPAFMRSRGFMYSLMMTECGKDFQVASTVIFNSLSGMRVGNNVYIAPDNVFVAVDVSIEDNVILGPGSVYSGGNHQFDGNSFKNLPSKSLGPIVLKEGSWVAANCTVTSGAVLPMHSILAAGAVLNKVMTDEKSIYAGIPAKRIGEVKLAVN